MVICKLLLLSTSKTSAEQMLSRLQTRPLVVSILKHTYSPRPLTIVAQRSNQLDTTAALAASRLSQVSRQFSTSPRTSAMDSKNNNNDAFKLENLFGVKGKVALVTGGGSGKSLP